MSRYFNVETFFKMFPELNVKPYNAAPTVDAVEVVHGEWVKEKAPYNDQRDNFYHCSVCGRAINIICGDKLENYPFCHCGACMKGNYDE